MYSWQSLFIPVYASAALPWTCNILEPSGRKSEGVRTPPPQSYASACRLLRWLVWLWVCVIAVRWGVTVGVKNSALGGWQAGRSRMVWCMIDCYGQRVDISKAAPLLWLTPLTSNTIPNWLLPWQPPGAAAVDTVEMGRMLCLTFKRQMYIISFFCFQYRQGDMQSSKPVLFMWKRIIIQSIS